MSGAPGGAGSGARQAEEGDARKSPDVTSSRNYPMGTSLITRISARDHADPDGTVWITIAGDTVISSMGRRNIDPSGGGSGGTVQVL